MVATFSPDLTPRERLVLSHVSTGLTNKEVAGAIGDISKRTVDAHMLAIYVKLGVDNRMRAVNVARQRGILQ